MVENDFNNASPLGEFHHAQNATIELCLLWIQNSHKNVIFFQNFIHNQILIPLRLWIHNQMEHNVFHITFIILIAFVRIYNFKKAGELI